MKRSKVKKLITIPKLLKKTEKIFNAYIRSRDSGLQCISCNNEGSQAGHYFPVRYSGVRFSEINVNLQDAYCNCYAYGNQAMYRIGLVKKYGEQAVKELEEEAVRTQYKKWTREELEWICITYGKIKTI
jgi:hypothetical protein